MNHVDNIMEKKSGLCIKFNKLLDGARSLYPNFQSGNR